MLDRRQPDGQTVYGLVGCAGPGPVSFVNCHFRAIHPNTATAPAGLVAAGGRLTVSGCLFEDTQAAQLVLEPPVEAAIITGNQFAGLHAIDHRAKGQVQIGLNVEGALTTARRFRRISPSTRKSPQSQGGLGKRVRR